MSSNSEFTNFVREKPAKTLIWIRRPVVGAQFVIASAIVCGACPRTRKSVDSLGIKHNGTGMLRHRHYFSNYELLAVTDPSHAADSREACVLLLHRQMYLPYLSSHINQTDDGFLRTKARAVITNPQ